MRLRLCLFLFCPALVLAQTASDTNLMAYYKQVISTLAHDSMMGRPAGSVYEQYSGRFIEQAFKSKKGAKPRQHTFSFRHPDSSTQTTATNVYCFLNNKKDSTIIIGAHYDHIGMGGQLSRSLLKKEVHNGADDNASGVALMLGLFSRYADWKNTNYNYLFVAYSAHEIGLFGSSAFGEFAMSKFKNICLVVNFDMVGRMDNNTRWLKIIATADSKGLRFFSEDKGTLRFRTENDYLLMQTDAKAFYQAGIPCLSISTGIHDDYHKITDDEAKINYTGILAIQQLMEQFLSGIP